MSSTKPWSCHSSSFRSTPFLLHRHVLSGMIVTQPQDQGTGTYYQLNLPDGNIGIGGSFDVDSVNIWKQDHRRFRRDSRLEGQDSTPAAGDVSINVDPPPSNNTSNNATMNGTIILLLTKTKDPEVYSRRLWWCRTGIVTAIAGQFLYLSLLAREPRQTSLFLNFCDPYPARPRRWTRQMVLLTQIITALVPRLESTYATIFSTGHLCLSFMLVLSTLIFCLDNAWDLISIACLILAWHCVDKDDQLRARHLVSLHE